MKKIARFIDVLLKLIIYLLPVWVFTVVVFLIASSYGGHYDIISWSSLNGYSATFYVLLFLVAYSGGTMTAMWEHKNTCPDALTRYYPPWLAGTAWWYFILAFGGEVPRGLIFYLGALACIYGWLSWNYAQYLDRHKKITEEVTA